MNRAQLHLSEKILCALNIWDLSLNLQRRGLENLNLILLLINILQTINMDLQIYNNFYKNKLIIQLKNKKPKNNNNIIKSFQFL